MKVTGEIFSLYKERKRAEEARYKKYLNFQVKRQSKNGYIAVRAALTGHLVLSTLHTNDAPSSVIRLIDIGIKPFLIPSSVIGVIAQRLVRKICPKCKKEMVLTPEVVKILEEYKDR